MEQTGSGAWRNQPPVVQIRGLTKTIRGKAIVNRLDLEVRAGEIFGLLGPNGAGKTTTIRMIVGLIGMSGGEVLIDGLSVKRQFEDAMKRVGAIVENPEMYKYLSGYHNLLHFARMHEGVTKARIDEVTELVGLKERIRDKVRTYSLGMRQRLGVAQALLHRPKVLILDEPTNGLDPAGIRELRDYLRQLARTEGLAIIVSSHLLSEMELMCDRVAIIRQGELIDVRPVRELAAGPSDAKLRVVFEVNEPASAQLLLASSYPEAAFQCTGPEPGGTPEGAVEGRLARRGIPSAVRTLVQAGIEVYGIRSSGRTLEEQFLELTGGERHA
ncbi:ABC transporter ATP-binding protein [Paenibacillus oleatilyticus]|uniref:ABC transporter ATP-binding protein n=1 Tax=Paenibacillus oleatilyticus TaxID=2594886 RepID=UPI001C1F38DE|nr:ABC transporter ATP-binding protein [Paenibacillus oleatilyticus]MBU7316346.1 ABC transporter ATP-binding protein [Paenibacillus oleatilyticus]